jgi:hypothetical protein
MNSASRLFALGDEGPAGSQRVCRLIVTYPRRLNCSKEESFSRLSSCISRSPKAAVHKLRLAPRETLRADAFAIGDKRRAAGKQ